MLFSIMWLCSGVCNTYFDNRHGIRGNGHFVTYQFAFHTSDVIFITREINS
jgi:hypothetical protein